MNSVIGPPVVPAGSPSIDRSNPRPSAAPTPAASPGAGLVQLPAGDGLDVGYRERNRIRHRRSQFGQQVQPATVQVDHGAFDLRSPLQLRGEPVDGLREHAQPHRFPRGHALHPHLGIAVAGAEERKHEHEEHPESAKPALASEGLDRVPVLHGEHLGEGGGTKQETARPPKVIPRLTEVTLDVRTVDSCRQHFMGNDCPRSCMTAFRPCRPDAAGPSDTTPERS